MADTRRTLAALQAIFADNGLGAIDGQDLRDFLLSTATPFGSYYVNTPGATSMASSGSWYKASGTTTSVSSIGGFTHSSNRLTYGGANTCYFKLYATCGAATSGTARAIWYSFHKNDTLITSSIVKSWHVDTNNRAITIIGECELATNDYVEVWLNNQTAGSETVTLNSAYVMAEGRIS